MKTPKELLSQLAKPEGVCLDGMEEWIATIQQESFSAGWNQGMHDAHDMATKGVDVQIALDAMDKKGLWSKPPHPCTGEG